MLFFAVSVGFFIYRHKPDGKSAAAVHKPDTGKTVKKTEYKDRGERQWAFYFEDSVAPSGRYIYLDRAKKDTVVLSNAEILRILNGATSSSIVSDARR